MSTKLTFENKPALGTGIYTVSEIAKILRLPYQKIYRWLKKYWDGELGTTYKGKYSWTVEKSRAVGFHTLVEFYIMMRLSEAGVTTREVLKAHNELSKTYVTAFPFAQRKVLHSIKTDGKKIYLSKNDQTITLDGSRQLNMTFIHNFIHNLEFDDDLIASRFWPLGKDKQIVIDPKRQFGHPVIGNTNIYPETICMLHEAGEPRKFIAGIYELTEEEVDDAIEYCRAA